jgi:hypothetical protein
MTKAAVTSFDFYMGHVIDGVSAVSGDTDLNLRNQYLGAVAEHVMAVKR